jgi:hypothetical protein
MAEKSVIDHAATKREAIELRDMYISLAAIEGIEGWLFGYQKDPVAGPNGRHGWQIYAVPRDK